MAIHFTPSTPVISDLTLHLQLSKQPDIPMQEIRTTFFPAEWFPQSGVQLTWPHAATDWAPLLGEADDCFVHIALEVLAHGEHVLIVTPEPERIQALLHERIPMRLLPNVSYFTCPTNDTWARDHAFLTLLTEDGPRLLDFQFNGWGMKFPADLDNQICRRLAGEAHGAIKCSESHESPAPLRGLYEPHLDFVLEGGSIESDGHGTLLTTSACLLAPNRNPLLTQQQIEERLLRIFHADRILWLDHGYLAGDDTDSHIDTLARFCPADTIAYVQCTDPSDEHYEALHAMEQQLASFRAPGASPHGSTSASQSSPRSLPTHTPAPASPRLRPRRRTSAASHLRQLPHHQPCRAHAHLRATRQRRPRTTSAAKCLPALRHRTRRLPRTHPPARLPALLHHAVPRRSVII